MLDGHVAENAVGYAKHARDFVQRLRRSREVEDVVDAVERVFYLVRQSPLTTLVDLHDGATGARDDLFGAVEDRGSFLILHIGAQDKNQLIAVQFGSPPTV